MADPNALLKILATPTDDTVDDQPVDKTDALIGLLDKPVDETAPAPKVAKERPQWNPKNTVGQVYVDTVDKVVDSSTYPLRHPIDTAKGLYSLATDSDARQAVADHFKQYGSIDGLRDAFVEDPSGVISELGGLATGVAGIGKGLIKAGAKATSKALPLVKNAKDSYIAPKMPPLTSEGQKAAAQRSYKIADESGVVIKPEAFKAFVDDLAPKMEKIGYDYGLHPQAERAMSRLNAAAVSGEAQPLTKLETLRRVASSARLNALNDDQVAKTTKVINHIDDFMKEMKPEHVEAGNAPRAVAALNDARPRWAKAMKIDDIQEILDIAKRQDNPNKYIKSQFGNITRDEDWFKQFTPAEKKIIVAVAKDGKLDQVGKLLSPRADISSATKLMIAPSIGFMVAGPAGAAAGSAVSGVMPIVGAASKAMGASSRLKNVEGLKDLISRGGPEPTMLDRIKAARAKRRMAGRDYLFNERDTLLPP